MSTDPAHSLGDALDRRLSSRIASVPTRAGRAIDAVELDAPRALARWLGGHRVALAEALEHGTWLDPADIDALLDLPLPGVDELVGLLEIWRLAAGSRSARRRYDVIVIDTAPTGHALRLLESPDAVAAVAAALDALQEEHRAIRAQLARVGRREAADALIGRLAGDAAALHDALRDTVRTSCCWVTLPEALSLAEAEDGITTLEQRGLAVETVIVNRIVADGPPCPICDRRRAAEARAIGAVRRRFGHGRRIVAVSDTVTEPKGVLRLASLGRQLSGTRGTRARSMRRRPPRGQALSVPRAAIAAMPDRLTIVDGASLLFVAGKGGVGKTTVAAALALRLARSAPQCRTLLLSTDPAHSLSDLFNLSGDIGDGVQSVPGAPANLSVREVDAAHALATRRDELARAFDEITATVGADAVGGDSRSAGRLLELAPPGIDELFGMLSVLDARDVYDLIIVDTAPTGHALRLLAMPDAAREWVQVLMRLLLKYRSVVRATRLAEELLELSRGIREFQELLRDGSRARAVVVTRAAVVPQLETVRLLARLRTLQLAVPVVVVNAMTLAPGACRRCRTIAAAERPVAAFWARRLRRDRCAIIQAPLAAPPPRGAEEVEEWGGRWITKG